MDTPVICIISAALRAAFGLSLLASAPAAAQPSLGADLPGVLAYLQQHHPELGALSAETDAARERHRAAGAWPDPMLQVELRDVPVRDPTLSPARAGNTRYAVRQSIPLGDKRTLQRRAAEAGIAVSEAQRSGALAELRARAKLAWSEYWYAGQAHRITDSVLALVSDLEQIARARYGNGLVPQSDAIRAQSELTSLQSDLLMFAGQRRQAAARLNALLARAPDAALAAPQEARLVPAVATDFAALSRRLGERSPELVLRGAQIAGAERAVDVTRANRWPDLTLGLAAIQRRTRLADYEVMVEVNIPWQRDVLRANENEAAAQLRATQLRHDAAALQLQGELADNWAALQSLIERGAVLRSTLLPQAQLNLDSALSGYQSGRVDFGALLDAERQIHRTRLELARIELEQQMRLAEVERIVGEDL